MNLIKLFGLAFLVTSLSCNSKTQNSITEGWKMAESILDSIHEPSFQNATYDITNYGAVGDGKTECTKAIKQAIRECTNNGGGVVLVPKGTFLTAAIQLDNDVNLHISEGAVLLFTTDKLKYLPVVHTRFEGMECMNYSPFIYAYKKINVAITGKGVIDGQGFHWWNWKGNWDGTVETGWEKNQPHQESDSDILRRMVDENVPLEKRVFGEGHFLRPNFIQTYACTNVLIENLTIKGSPMWNIHPVLCENVIVRGIKIESLGPNNDGCNPESSRNILIENCYFNTGDDCIAIKSGRNNDGFRFAKPSENIIIRKCKMIEGHGGIVIGSEISGNVRNVFAEDCIMNSPNLDRAVRIKSNSKRGGIVEKIYVRNFTVHQVKEAVLKINMFYSDDRDKNIPLVRDIYLENIVSHSSKYGVWIKAYKEKPAQNIHISNCSFNQVKKDNVIENIENITLENVKLNGSIISEF